MSHRSNNNHLNNGDTDDPISHRTERTTATRAATMTPTATATTTAEHKISSHVNQQQQQQQQHYSYYNSSFATPFYSQNHLQNIGETYPHHVADAAAQVWNEWMHEEDQTLQSGSSNNSNRPASMSATEEALRNMQQQQQQQRCYNDRINSPNRHRRFSAESPVMSTLPFTHAQMQQFPKRMSTEFITQNRYAQQDAYRSYHMLQPILMVMVPPARSLHYILHSIYFTLKFRNLIAHTFVAKAHKQNRNVVLFSTS
jgi:hypothetical protein